VNVAVPPTAAVWFDGCVVIDGGVASGGCVVVDGDEVAAPAPPALPPPWHAPRAKSSPAEKIMQIGRRMARPFGLRRAEFQTKQRHVAMARHGNTSDN
jgi:hypothetical protein